jgi:hypothetical protein
LEKHVEVIPGKSFPQLTEEEKLCNWFQLHSATAHTAHVCMQALSAVFGDRIISSDIWPARSPERNPDFFFWCCLKDKVYNSNPRTEELKENIRREIANIPPAQQLQGLNQNLFLRC